jgi:hypothetical protein
MCRMHFGWTSLSIARRPVQLTSSALKELMAVKVWRYCRQEVVFDLLNVAPETRDPFDTRAKFAYSHS